MHWSPEYLQFLALLCVHISNVTLKVLLLVRVVGICGYSLGILSGFPEKNLPWSSRKRINQILSFSAEVHPEPSNQRATEPLPEPSTRPSWGPDVDTQPHSQVQPSSHLRSRAPLGLGTDTQLAAGFLFHKCCTVFLGQGNAQSIVLMNSLLFIAILNSEEKPFLRLNNLP